MPALLPAPADGGPAPLYPAGTEPKGIFTGLADERGRAEELAQLRARFTDLERELAAAPAPAAPERAQPKGTPDGGSEPPKDDPPRQESPAPGKDQRDA